MHLAMLLLSASLTVPPSYVLVTPSDTSTYGQFTVDDVQTIRDVYGPRVFFFRSNGRAYVIFDQKVIESLSTMFRQKQSSKLGTDLATLTGQWIRTGVAKALQR